MGLVPSNVAKGLNLAASDVAYLSDALIGYFRRADNDGVAGLLAKALARVWKSERFSRSLTKLMHRFADDGPFERRMQVAELEYIAGSRAARTAIAENYVGLPLWMASGLDADAAGPHKIPIRNDVQPGRQA